MAVASGRDARVYPVPATIAMSARLRSVMGRTQRNETVTQQPEPSDHELETAQGSETGK